MQLPWPETRSWRFTGLCKRGARFPISKHGGFPVLLAAGCSHTQRTWPLALPQPHAVDTVHKRYTGPSGLLSSSSKAAFRHSLLSPPRPCIPHWNPYHSTTAWTPTSDPPMSLLAGACRLRGLPGAASSLLQPHNLRVRACQQPQPLQVRLIVFPQGRQCGPEMTQLLPCPLLSLMEQVGAASWLGWNRRRKKPRDQNLM